MNVQPVATNSPSSYAELLAELWRVHLSPKSPEAPTVISTFAGCGGSSLGYSMAGFRELLAVEWEDDAVATFKRNFHDVPIWQRDIATIEAEQILEFCNLKRGELDVFDGSPPCQGFSTAGKRELLDSRNSLFQEFCRLLGGLQPKAFVMENVSGMVKGKMKLVFAEALRSLKKCGYLVSARLLNASYFQVPQARQRIIFIGHREDLGTSPTHPSAFSAPVTVKAAIGDLEGSIEDRQMKDWLRTLHPSIAPGISGGPQMRRYFRSCPAASSGGWLSTSKLHPNRPSFTITKSEISVTGLLHYSKPRYLTQNELARLGSFPDDFQFTDRPHAVQRIGNSVPPLMMFHIAKHLRRSLSLGPD